MPLVPFLARRASRVLSSLTKTLSSHLPFQNPSPLPKSQKCTIQTLSPDAPPLEETSSASKPFEKEGFHHSDISSNTLRGQLQLAETNSAMGRKMDALVNLKNALELQKLILHPKSKELAAAYKELAEAHAVVSEFDSALPLCLHALKILEFCFGHGSAEVARAHRLLGAIYIGLGKNVEALEQHELSLGILDSLGLETGILDSKIDMGNAKIAMARFGEAVEILRSAIKNVGKEGEARALVFISMAKALYGQEKFGDAKRCLEIACGNLDNLDSTSSSRAFEAYAEISMMYETMNEFETALSLMKRTVAVVEKHPREKHLEGSVSARVGWLLLLTGRTHEAVTYLERARERLEESFGATHFGFGFVCKHLGQAYLETSRCPEAVETLKTAYIVLIKWFGSHHEDTIDACQLLANAYGAKASFSPVELRQRDYASAIEFQQRVIDAWENHGPTAKNELREAHRLFEHLKRRAQGLPSAVYPANNLSLSYCK